ncbi:hypothetical protein LCGC14_1990660 [marine sediment metagenome]|uniref:Uncharacterized protein n=1 Tax=marine sediment metagenome TaxID=412755 RepID=A0A0F9I3A4_9ZZZZ
MRSSIARIPKTVTHTHYHTHHNAPDMLYKSDYHQHQHSHVNHDTPDVPEYDHHSVTKAKEEKDVYPK